MSPFSRELEDSKLLLSLGGPGDLENRPFLLEDRET